MVNFNIWMGISAILLIALILYVLTGGLTGITGAVILDSHQAADKALAFVNNNLVQTGKVELVDVTESNGMYKVTTSYQGQEIDIYVTKDGEKLFVASPYDMTKEIPKQTQSPEQTDVPKSDKPKVELFVMSHCPYGTQMEKAILPVAELLKDKIDFEIKFVYYAMHPSQGEVEEQLRQYCIQKYQNDKFLNYLKYFLEKGDSEASLTKAGIDKTKLETDMKMIDKEFNVLENLNDQSSWLSGRFPKFDIYKSDNEKYNVAGSPTLIINGKTVSASRSPEAIKQAVCNAFNTAPKECSQELSTEQASPGFGYNVGTGSSGSCG